MGDSYASGQGAGSYDDASGSCYRSARAWPRLLGATVRHHLACSGATTANVLSRPRGPHKVPQIRSLQQLSDRTTIDVALVTIGGNDLRFASKVAACRFHFRPCLADRAKSDEELARLRPRIVATYRGIRRVTDARVVAIGYPDITPGAGEPDTCRWLSKTERANVEDFARRLDVMFSEAATEAGIDYVSVRGALDGHELCTQEAWMVGITRLGRNWLTDSEQGHPNWRGHRAIADLVSLAL